MKNFLIALTLCYAAVQAHYVIVERDTTQTTPAGRLGRIVQGHPAVNGQFPHMAYFGCGGSLISPLWVLTAATCLDYQKRLQEPIIYLGDVNRTMSPVQIKINKYYIHPAYKYDPIQNDVGLIEFDSPVTLSENIKPIRVANSRDELYDGEVATLSGFGWTVDTPGYPEVLRYVDLKVISNAECWEVMTNVNDYVICAKGIESPLQGGCFGDAGGGLILRRPGEEDLLIGIASFTMFGCPSQEPTAFMRPNFFLEWIRDTTGLDI